MFPNAARTGSASGVLFRRGQENEACAFFVVAGEIVKVIFLREDVCLRDFFSPGEAPENDGDFGLHGKFGATLGINAVRFAFAALLRIKLWSACRGGEKNRGKREQ